MSALTRFFSKKAMDISNCEVGTVSTSGTTRTITLNGNYTAMDAFLVNIISGQYEGAFVLKDTVTFTAPNQISFEIVNDAGESTSARYDASYLFKGH